MIGTLYVGCAVWAYDGWANSFFPKGLPKDERLRAYSQRLTAVEGNSTFYALPSVPTVQRWATDTPESFRFVPKFPKAVSHTARLKDVKAQTTTFIGVMRVLGPRLGPLMLQLPPTFGPPMLLTLCAFLEELPKDLQISVEVRHLDWFKPDNAAKLDEMLAAVGAGRVVFDSRPTYASEAPDAVKAQEKKPNVPVVANATQPFVVVRYISSPILAENTAYIAEWTPRLVAWLREGRHVYFFAHCPVEELSPGIARMVYQQVAATIADAQTKATKRTKTEPAESPESLPALPWDEAENPNSVQTPTQLSLF